MRCIPVSTVTAGRLWIAAWTLAWLLVAVCVGPPIQAQDHLDQKQPEIVIAPDRVVRRATDFDRWVLKVLGGKTEAPIRLESILTARVEKVARQSGLTEFQRKKLTLAGRGDIKRLVDRATKSRSDLADDANEGQALANEGPPPLSWRRESIGDVFGQGSFFAKVLKSTLIAEQAAQYERAVRIETLARHRATIHWVVDTLDATLQINGVARGQLEALFVKNTRPPRSFGDHDYYGLLFQVSKLPDSAFQSILNESQWAKLSKHIAESKRLLPTLKEGGFIPDEDIVSAPRPIGAPLNNQQNKRG
jgi:hypothetical protein